MKNYDPNLGTKRLEQRRFRLFMLFMLPLAVLLGHLATLNPPDPSKLESHGNKASLSEAFREIWLAFKVAYTVDLSSGDLPSEPRHSK